MINRFVASQRVRMMTQARLFSSFNYRSASNPRVWMNLQRNGKDAGKIEIELFANHSPSLAANFQQLCKEGAKRSFAGTSFNRAVEGHGIYGGLIEGDCQNWGADAMRLPDDNLDVRHHKRGVVSMANHGMNANGSEFVITFGEAHYLDGYNNVVGEVVSGDDVVDQMEADSNREWKMEVEADWKIAKVGHC